MNKYVWPLILLLLLWLLGGTWWFNKYWPYSPCNAGNGIVAADDANNNANAIVPPVVEKEPIKIPLEIKDGGIADR